MKSFQKNLLVEKLTAHAYGMRQIHLERMKRIIGDYFKETLNCTMFEFQEKIEGNYLGCIVDAIIDDLPRTFFVKYHSRGRVNHLLSRPAFTVDPLELVIYKFLEYSKMCPQVHFIKRTSEDFYIMTLDAGTFQPFSTMQNLDLTYTIEEMKMKDDHWLIEGLTLLEIVETLFKVKDGRNNNDNFGFLEDGSVQLIDFILPRTCHMWFTQSPILKHVQEQSCPAHRYALGERDRLTKAKTYLSLMNKFPLIEFDSNLDLAFKFVKPFLEEHPTLIEEASIKIQRIKSTFVDWKNEVERLITRSDVKE